MSPQKRELHTILLLRMSAIQLRQAADMAPEMAAELRHIAAELETEADDLRAPPPLPLSLPRLRAPRPPRRPKRLH